MTRVFNWTKSPEDSRDLFHNFTISRNVTQPILVDLRPGCPAVYDQGTLGSCVANSVGAAYQYNQIKQKKYTPFTPSRLFVYYNARKMMGTVNQDSGCYIRDGIKSINTTGVCPETMWPYVITKFATVPPTASYIEARKHISLVYKRVIQNLDQFKQCLISGFPISCGIMLYEKFMSPQVAKDGIISIPVANEKMLGGHAILIVGFDETKKRFIVRNSWGANWGDKGYFYLPYEYLVNPQLAGDFWTVNSVVDRNIHEN